MAKKILNTNIDILGQLNLSSLNNEAPNYILSLNSINNVVMRTPSEILSDIGVLGQYQLLSEKGEPSGYVPLDSSGEIPQQFLPAITITETFVVSSEAAMIALTAQMGDVAIRTDESKSYILQGSDPTIASNWQELLSPTGGVSSVNGLSGVVTLDLSFTSGVLGITGGNTVNLDNRYYSIAQLNTSGFSNVHWNNITNRPTTISGYGITNAYTKSETLQYFLRRDVNDTFSGQFMTFDNTANHGIVTGSDSQRLLIGGGSNWNSNNGAYISIEGLDYGGTDAGGDIHLLPGAGGILNSPTGLKVSNASGAITNSNNNIMLRSNGSATVLSSANDAVYIRPVSDSSTTGQLVLNTSGSVVTSNNLTVNGSAIVSGNLNANIVIGQGNANAIRVHGTSTGNANIAYASFYESNGSNRQGYIGFPSSSSGHLILHNDLGSNQIILNQNGGENGLQYYQGSNTRTVYHSGNLRSNSQNDARYAVMNNTTANTGNLNIIQSNSGSPTLGTRGDSPLTIGSSYGMAYTQYGSGHGSIQMQRFDGVNTTYNLNLNPLGGDVTINGNTAYHTGNIRSNSQNDARYFPRAVGIPSGDANDFREDGYVNARPWATNTPPISHGTTFGFGENASGFRQIHMSDAGDIAVRALNYNNTAWSDWHTLWHDGNFNPSSYVPTSRTITAGTGLTGGGNLTANRTINVSFGTTSSTVARGNDSRINNGQTAFGWGNHASAGYVPSGRTISTGSGLSGGGNLGSNRTLSVDSTVARTNVAETFSSTITATNFILSSDRRLKENIESLGNGYYTFNFKDDKTKRKRYGAMADEVKEYAPELIYENEEGYEQVGYIDFLIKKIAELEERLNKIEI